MEDAAAAAEPGLDKEEIALPDGRYLIYYAFGDDDDGAAGAAEDGP